MVNPFIRNHQYNMIKKQVKLLQNACSTVSDPKVVEAVRTTAVTKVLDAFPEATAFQKQYFEKISTLNRTEDFQTYLQSLEPFLAEFEKVSSAQIKKLFPKVKKLKLPDLDVLDYKSITYIGWTDIATNKMFLLYNLDGKLVGIEGKFTRANKKSTCCLCNRHEEVALFSAIAKSKPANASPDYYKAIGNYMCVSSDICNKNISEVEVLEKFIRNLLE